MINHFPLLLIVPPVVRSSRRPHRMVERQVMCYRRSWPILLSGFFEPLFYLLSIRVGLSSLVGTITVGDTVFSYAEFVAPAMMAASAMNGAVYDSTMNVHKLKYARVYDAVLWTPAGQRVTAADAASQALALEIRYQRALQGQQIAERSLLEMRRQGDIDDAVAQRWLQTMTGLFPDVVEGSRITAVNLPREGARFFVDGRLKGSVAEPEFARRFFGIWLSPQSSDQKLRLALLGQGQASFRP